MSGFFINYRGDDSQTTAVLIDRELVRRFGRDQVFLDCRSIPPGVRFAEAIRAKLGECSVLLAVIGPSWSTLTDESGRRRIDDPEDWIRLEIAAALRRKVLVIPVLTDGAVLPAEADLPSDIAELGGLQYLPLRRRYADIDLDALVRHLRQLHPELAVPQPNAGRRPPPRQLPAAPGRFTGRADELAALTAALDETTASGATVLISAIGGAGGIGKTWLALHWAHRHAELFPDGQLFVDLRGFTPDGKPLPTMVAVRGFLDALGVEPSTMPADPDAQVGLYRSLVADRRMLILLDNAADTEQVAPLLPGGSSCVVVVTSRRRLDDLVGGHCARSVELDVLTTAEARHLLTAHLGADRVAGEPDAVDQLLDACAGLPLALSIVAARASARPGFPLRRLAGELRDHATRLDSLNAGELPHHLRAVFTSSYRALSKPTAALFCLLGTAPGPDIGVPAAAALAGLPVRQVRALLRELEHVHLVDQPVPDRYRLHDLVRLYADERAGQDVGQPVEPAQRRLVGFYLHTAHAGDRLLDPHSDPIEPDRPPPGCTPQPLPDDTAAVQWFEAEHACLLAAQRLALDRGWYREVYQLAWSVDTYHFRQGLLQDNLTIWQSALTAAGHLDDRTVLARTHQTLGRAYGRAARLDEAVVHLDQALRLAGELGDHYIQALVHRAFAGIRERQDDIEAALRHATSALTHFRALGRSTWGEGTMLTDMARYAARLGRFEQARDHCEAALAQHRLHRNREGEATTLDTLGDLDHRTGDHARAAGHLRQAITLCREVRYPYLEADSHQRLGHVLAALGDPAAARQAWQDALALYRHQCRDLDAERVRHHIDALRRRHGEPAPCDQVRS